MPPDGDAACASERPTYAKPRATPPAIAARTFPRRGAKRRLFTTTRASTVESFTLLTPGYRGNRPSCTSLTEESANGARKNDEAGERQPAGWEEDTTPLAWSAASVCCS